MNTRRIKNVDVTSLPEDMTVSSVMKYMDEHNGELPAEVGYTLADYYTPNIDEFYQGFEFEYLCEEGNLLKREDTVIEFRKQIFDPDWANIMFDEYEHETKESIKSQYRVKYLDKEDIESLGFKYDNNAEPYPERDPVALSTTKGLGHIYHSLQAFDLDTQLEDGICYILYLYSDGVVWIEWIKDCIGMGYIFKGILKNKSELTKLLKQIGIRFKGNEE